MSNIVRHPIILDKNKTALLVVDVQEKIYKVVRKPEKLLNNISKLIKGMNFLNIPIYYTEQYPKGLGETVEIIKSEIKNPARQKLSFSCTGAEDLFFQFTDKGIKQVIVCGVESHVCVQQTVLDLIANGYQVIVPIDAISSRFKIDFKTAVKRMAKHGAEITTIEAILFEVMENCKVPEFKTVTSLIK